MGNFGIGVQQQFGTTWFFYISANQPVILHLNRNKDHIQYSTEQAARVKKSTKTWLSEVQYEILGSQSHQSIISLSIWLPKLYNMYYTVYCSLGVNLSLESETTHVNVRKRISFSKNSIFRRLYAYQLPNSESRLILNSNRKWKGHGKNKNKS